MKENKEFRNITHKDIAIHIYDKFKEPMYSSDMIDLVIRHEAESRFGIDYLGDNEVQFIKKILHYYNLDKKRYDF